jgi:beta-lactamase superfamily II metal-dependent hydrolase
MTYLIKFFQAGCGDAIHINYKGASGKVRHILVDGGFMMTYMAHLKKILTKLPDEEFIDLWVITHMDTDHINGALGHFMDKSIRPGKELIKQVWFNYFDRFSLPDNTTKIGIGSAIKLRDHLTPERCASVRHRIAAEIDPVDLDGAMLTVLCPDKGALEVLGNHWEALEEEFHNRPTAVKAADDEVTYPDDDLSVEKLAMRPQPDEDEKDIANRSSIAFLFEYQQISTLFLGDAHPSIVIASIRQLNEKRKCKLKVDYIKLSHHGSRHNFHPNLLEVVDCSDFIILSKGEGCHKLPNKETLSRILVKRKGLGKTNFYFNYHQQRFRTMFAHTNDKKFDFELFFPEEGQTFLKLGNEF